MRQIANGQIQGTFFGQSIAQRQKKTDRLKARHDEVVRHEDAHYRKAAEHGLKPDADKQIAAKGRAIIAANEPKAQRLQEFKSNLKNSGFTLPPSMVKSMVAGLGLDIPQGQLMDLAGV